MPENSDSRPPCEVRDFDRFGNNCVVHGWDVTKECYESERLAVPAPPREPVPGQFLMSP